MTPHEAQDMIWALQPGGIMAFSCGCGASMSDNGEKEQTWCLKHALQETFEENRNV